MLQRPGPPPFSANPRLVFKRRWILRPAVGTDKVSDAFQVSVAPSTLVRSVGMVTDDVSNPSQYYGLFSAIKIQRIQMWYAAPVKAATGTASDMPSSGGYSISVTPVSQFTTAYLFGEKSDTSTGPDDCAYVNFVPDPVNYPGLCAFQPGNNTNAQFILKGYPGTVVDIQMEAIIADGSYTNVNGTTSPAAAGSIGYGYLDDGLTAGTRSWQPVGCTEVFS